MSEHLGSSLADWNKRGALEEIENLKTIRSNAWDEHTHSFRWLMASLLAANGGACLAIVGQEEVAVEHRLWACGAFVLGILAALLVAVFGQYSVQRSLASLQTFIGYWLTVVEDGERDEELEQSLNSELRSSAKLGYGSQIVSRLSAAAFFAGVVTSGMGLVHEVDPAAADGVITGI